MLCRCCACGRAGCCPALAATAAAALPLLLLLLPSVGPATWLIGGAPPLPPSTPTPLLPTPPVDRHRLRPVPGQRALPHAHHLAGRCLHPQAGRRLAVPAGKRAPGWWPCCRPAGPCPLPLHATRPATAARHGRRCRACSCPRLLAFSPVLPPPRAPAGGPAAGALPGLLHLRPHDRQCCPHRDGHPARARRAGAAARRRRRGVAVAAAAGCCGLSHVPAAGLSTANPPTRPLLHPARCPHLSPPACDRSCWRSATRWACLTRLPRWQWRRTCATCTAWCVRVCVRTRVCVSACGVAAARGRLDSATRLLQAPPRTVGHGPPPPLLPPRRPAPLRPMPPAVLRCRCWWTRRWRPTSLTT